MAIFSGDEDAPQEHPEAVQSVANHVAGIIPVGDAENNGSEERENQRRTEMIESDRHRMIPSCKGLADS